MAHEKFSNSAKKQQVIKGLMPPLGIVYFVDEVADEAFVWDDETPDGRQIDDATTLASDTVYLSNIDFKTFNEDSLWRALHDGLKPDSYYRLRLIALMKELGGNPKSTADWKRLAPVLRTTLRESLILAGYDYQAERPWQVMTKQLSTGWANKQPALPREVVGDLVRSGAPHWIQVHSVRSQEKKRFVVLQADRFGLFRDLTEARVPVGDWTRHEVDDDQPVSLSDLKELRTAINDVVVRVRVTDRMAEDSEGAVRLPGVEETGETRMYLTGPELEAMDAGAQDFQVTHYYQGPVKALTNALSHLDSATYRSSLAYDLAHRARKLHRGYGFWISILERIWLHQSVRELSLIDGVEIAAYGSGKVMVKIPAAADVFEETMVELHRYCVRRGLLMPVPKDFGLDALETLLSQCDGNLLQIAMIGAPEMLDRFDQAHIEGGAMAEKVAFEIEDAITERLDGAFDDQAEDD